MIRFWQRGIARLLLALGVVMGYLTPSVSAAADEPSITRGQMLFAGSKYICFNCHNGNPNKDGFNAGSPLLFASNWSDSPAAFIDRLKDVAKSGSPQMSTLGNAASISGSTAEQEATDLYNFLIDTRNHLNPTAVISSPKTSVSVGESFPISGSGSSPQNRVSYTWAVVGPDGPLAQPDAATITPTFSKAGPYNVQLTITTNPVVASNPSHAVATAGGVTVTAFPLPAAKITIPAIPPTSPPTTPRATIVPNGELEFSGADSTPSGLSYRWEVSGSALVEGTPGTASTQKFKFPSEGNYSVKLTVTQTATGKVASDTVAIAVVKPTPVVPLAAVINDPATAEISVRVNNTVQVSGTESTPKGDVSYQWSVKNPAGQTTITNFGSAATHSVPLTEVGDYTVVLVVQRISTMTNSGPVTVTIHSTPVPVVPTPDYLPSGFEALSRFSAPANGSQTLCPTIRNSGTGTLDLSFSALQASGSSADFSSYFELGDSASCPATPRACTSLPAGSPISGTTSLPAPADPVCTLALRFNPAKIGPGAGLGARSALLRIAHNGPPGTVVAVPLSGNVTPVPQPAIGLSTNPGVVNGRITPPAFAAQVVNTASALWNEFLVFNIGTQNGLDLTEASNTNTQEFALTENCVAAAPLAIVSGNDPHCTIGLRFTPSAIGERCTAVTVRAAVGGINVVDVCGTGVARPEPDLTLSRDVIDFGRRFLNASYPPQPLVIGNGTGATDFLRINAVTLAGTGFTLVAGGDTSLASCVGASLAAGASCTLQVQFTPDPARPETPYSASLLIDTNDVSTPRRTILLAAVAGTAATPPLLQFANAPAQLEFTDVVVAGQQSAQAPGLTLRNAGPGAATIDAIRTVGADASSFSAGGCPATLQEGDTCNISVRFTPGSGGQKRAQLEVLSSRSIAPPLVTMTGRGVGGTSAFLTASSAGLSLGGVRVGARSEPLELRLASAGDGVVTVTGMQADAPFTVQSKTCPSVPFTLPRGGDCTVTVSFTPTDARTASASLRISTDADTKPLVVPLTGTGEEKANLSSGGCSIASGDTPFDPTLWALVLLAIGAIVYRRRVRAAGGQR